jgi:hypothetical protein
MKKESGIYLHALCFRRWSSAFIILSALVGSAFARHFNPLDSQTGATLTVFLDTAAHPTLNGTPIRNNNIVPDEIGVFDSLGNCWGVGYWPAGPDSTIAVAGYQSTGSTKAGMTSGEKMYFRVWDTTLGEMPATVTYYPTTGAVPFPPAMTPSTESTFVAGNPIAYSVPKSITGLATPQAPALATPTNGAANQATALTFSWTSSAGAASYAFQISTVSTFASTVSNKTGIAGTSNALSGLANNSTYYWRANATNSVGTSAWSGIWRFTTAIAVPAAPALSTPTNGATGLATSLTLSWTAVTGATTYAAQVSTISTFATTVSSQTGLSVTSAAVAGLAGGATYYWRADAGNTAGTSAWSSVWHFATKGVPVAPALASPSNGAANQATTLTVSWAASTGAATYAAQVSTVSTFASTVVNQTGIAATSASVAGLAYGKTYYWRANATNTVGTSAWSGIWSFATLATPAAPALSSPANGATNQAAALTVSWTASSGAATYAVQVSTVSTFASTVAGQTALAATSAAVSGLSGGITFYWHANATNAAGTSAWSSVWSFATLAAPGIPALAAPTNGSTGQALAPALSWTTVTGAATYGCQVSTVSTFVNTLVSQTGLTAATATASGLTNSTKYYWRANAVNAAGTSAWSTVWNFTTLAPSAIVALSSPANAATNEPTSLTMSWGSGTGALSYTLQISTVSTFASTVSSQAGISATSKAVTGLTVSTRYYWHVNATTTSGAGTWSSVWSFTTVPAAPAAPTLSSPSNGASYTANTAVTLSWGTVTGATSFTVQVSTVSTFATTAFSQSGATNSVSFTTGVAATYYWRVDASNAGGTSAWSTTRTFSISAKTSVLVPVLVSSGKEIRQVVSFSRNAISYSLKEPAKVEIALFDILGRKAASFGFMQSAGSYHLSLTQSMLPSGRYLLQFKAGGLSRSMAITLTR